MVREEQDEEDLLQQSVFKLRSEDKTLSRSTGAEEMQHRPGAERGLCSTERGL